MPHIPFKAFFPGFLVLFCLNTFGQSSSNKILPRDWFTQDPKEDSIAGISLSKAYKLLNGKKYKIVVVAVIDNGVDISHEDLNNIIWTNTREIPDNGIDDDGNGYIDDIHGWNFRGTKDGTIIENEQAGPTQFYLAWKSKFENVHTNNLSVKDRKYFTIYKRAKKKYLENLTSKDSNDIQFAYNINYHSNELIANDSASEVNRYYGSPYLKLTKNLSHGT